MGTFSSCNRISYSLLHSYLVLSCPLFTLSHLCSHHDLATFYPSLLGLQLDMFRENNVGLVVTGLGDMKEVADEGYIVEFFVFLEGEVWRNTLLGLDILQM